MLTAMAVAAAVGVGVPRTLVLVCIATEDNFLRGLMVVKGERPTPTDVDDDDDDAADT